MTPDEQLEAMTGSGSPRAKALSVMREAVAEAFSVTDDDIRGRVRTRGLVEARQCLYLLARRCTRLSLPELGHALGRDHSTILDGVRVAQSRANTDQWYGIAVRSLLLQFGGSTDGL